MLYSQIDVAVVDRSVTSISATTIPLERAGLVGAKRVSAARARAIARRRIAGPDSALPAQPIADAGKPGAPHAPRRAWVVQVTRKTGGTQSEEDLNLCVVIDAQSGKVLDVWKGVAAPAGARASSTRPPAARVAQAGETNVTFVRDAKSTPGTIGSIVGAIATTGNPFLYGDDLDFFTIHLLPAGTTKVSPEASKALTFMQNVPHHMCRLRGFCGRDGGFDGTFDQFRVTVRAPEQQPDKGTRFTESDQRVYLTSAHAAANDILAHELGHLMDITYGGDRILNQDVREAQEALADMYAYDFDHDPTLGEDAGFRNMDWSNPNTVNSPLENAPYPARNPRVQVHTHR